MIFSSCITNEDSQIVLDTSVVINLLATGHATSILQALEIPVLITGNVEHEISSGSISARPEADELRSLIKGHVLLVKKLEGQASATFIELVGGPVADSLDDGEAATLAFAHHNRLSAAIDEKKATRIAAERFASLRLVSTVDIFAFGPVQTKLGRTALADALFRALSLARMQVRDAQFDWVVDVIGSENVQACSSLRRHIKRRSTIQSPAAKTKLRREPSAF
jgi:predicted nucleic acid-binding protein